MTDNKKETLLTMKLRIPCILMLFVVLNLYWALWKEQQIFAHMYSLCSMAMVTWMAIHIITNIKTKYDSALLFQFAATLIWCLVMAYAYTYGYPAKTVSFFGIKMDQHARIILYDAILLLPGIFFANKYKVKFSKYLKAIVFAAVITSLILSVIAVIRFPDAMRERQSLTNAGKEEILYGLPDYSVIYGLSLITPWFLWKAQKTSGNAKLYYGITTACLIILIALSQFATALLALIAGIITYFLIKAKNNTVGVLFWALIVMVLVGIGNDGLAALFNSIASAVEGSWAEKLQDIANSLIGGSSEGDLEGRLELYAVSFNSFLESPVFGSLTAGRIEIGGHATLLDMLALTGFFGTIIFVAIIFLSFFKTMRTINANSGKAALGGILVTYLIFFCTKNCISAITINFSYFVLVPILFNSEEV